MCKSSVVGIAGAFGNCYNVNGFFFGVGWGDFFISLSSSIVFFERKLH